MNIIMYQNSNVDKGLIPDKFDYCFDSNQIQVQQQQTIDSNQQVFFQPRLEFSNEIYYQKEQEKDDSHEARISFEEIDAIINSKDFGDIVQQKATIEQVSINDSCSPNMINKMTDNQATKNLFNFQHQPQQQQQNQQQHQHQHQQQLLQDFNDESVSSKPFVEIVEQPAKCSLRFRYKCEGRSAGSLPGVSSTGDNKTYPAIRIVNYTGRAVVVVSCVTKDAPYRAHPHNIVGKEGCKKGICTIVISNNELNTIRTFSSLGIQCVKRKDIEESLNLRESINVDPFRNGFAHKHSASTIDLNVVRLSFQVFIVGSTPNRCDVPLMPVVSNPIHDKKAMSDLVITKLSHCSAPATGGREIILLCDRISKDDIQVRFYEEQNGKLIWETYTELSPTDIHKQVAICFKTPKYYNENITQPVMVCVQLKRVSDGQVSEPRLFQFLPCESDEDIISRKRQKIEWVHMNQNALDNIFQPNLHQQRANLNVTAPNQQFDLNINRRLSSRPSETSPSPSHSRRNSPLPPVQLNQPVSDPLRLASISTSSDSHQSTPSPSNQQQQQQQQNVVVRREIIDNDGKVMRLVDRPTNNRVNERQQHEAKPLGSSLDRIDTAELMQDMAFNSNMDLNLSSNLSIHLNPTN